MTRAESPVGAGRLLVCPGPRIAEDLLLATLRELRERARQEGRIAAARVVVPSSGVREHLIGRIAATAGPAVLGVEVTTAYALARRSCEGAGVALRGVSGLFGVLARRAAREEPSLARILGELEDGFGAAVSSAGDLLSAGLGQGALEALRGAARGDEAERALAVARVGLAARRELEALGCTRDTDLYGRAAEIIDAAPCRDSQVSVLIHGFADVTGQGARLLAALLRRGATMLVDDPPDPRAPGATQDPLRRGSFVRHLLTRMETLAGVKAQPVDARRRAPALALVSAAGADSEVREVARQVAALIRQGVAPERMGIVARQIAPYALAIRDVSRELAVPHRPVLAPAGAYPQLRRLAAAVEVLRRGPEVRVDVAFAAAGRPRWGSEGRRDDEREVEEHEGVVSCAASATVALAARSLGATRLGELAGLELEALFGGDAALALPLRRGLEVDEDGSGRLRARAGRQSLGREALEEAVAWSRGLLEMLASWPGEEPVGEGAARLRRCFEALWRGDEGDPPWRIPLEALPVGLDGLRLSLDELLGLFEAAAQGVSPEPLAGSGVRILDATQARGQTFEHLFVLGCNRDSFPRRVTEDPLVPDSLRRRWGATLPDLHPKGRGLAEERHLFAQLLGSAEQVTLCWQRADEEGKLRLPSPLLERLRFGEGGLPKPRRLPRLRREALCAPFAGGSTRPRSAREWALVLALAGQRGDLEAPWAAVAGEAGAGPDAAPTADGQISEGDLAAARRAILEEQDPPLGSDLARSPGPYLGFVGGLARADDPRRAGLYVTTLEDLARCPWRALLVDLLRVEAPRDPRGALPGIDAALLGETAHRSLERLVGVSSSRPRGASWRVRRPGQSALESAVSAAAEAVADERGLRWPGLRRALAQRAMPLVQRAIELDWPHAGAEVQLVGAEEGRKLTVSDSEGRPRTLRFKVDRVDLHGGGLVLSDYKSGRPPSLGKRAETRRRQLRGAIARGERLQVAAYAATSRGAVGRYVFLDPSLPQEVAVARLEEKDPAVQRTLPRVLRDLMEAWESGVFFPRLEDLRGNEPRSCRHCPVAEACARGDSGARGRLRAVAEASRGEARRYDGPRWQERFAALYWLGAAGPEEG